MTKLVAAALFIVVAAPLYGQTTAYTSADMVGLCGYVVSPPARETDIFTNGRVDPAKLERVLSALEKEVHGKAACLAYVVGVVDATMAAAVADKTDPVFCMPDGPSRLELVKIFLKYMDDHPASLHDPAVYSISLALIGAFPCKSHPIDWSDILKTAVPQPK